MRLSPLLAPNEQLLAQVIQELMSTIHLNEYGLPLGFYRPDLLPLEDYQPEGKAADKLYEAATTLLEPPKGREIRAELYDDGFDPLVLVGQGDEVEYAEYDEPDTAQEVGASDQESVGRGGEEGETAYASGASVEIEGQTPSLVDTSRVAGFLREDLKAAFIPLNYDEGFPTLPDGQPFWDRFEFEPIPYHTAFQAYLQMPMVNRGVRSLSDLAAIMEKNGLLELDGFTYKDYTLKFQILSQIYLWPIRAKTYDLYKAAAHKKQQELRALSVQEHHYNMSTRLMNRLSEYMEGEEFWELMTPKVAMDMFKALVATQRISVGLPASAPPIKDGEGSTSFEMILRTLAQQGGAQEIAKSGQDNRLAARILENPKTTELAQELIIRMSQGESQDGQ